MNRRNFLRNSSYYAFAVSTFGVVACKKEGIASINAPKNAYTSECQTTADILGPFYRPNAPVRYDLTIAGQTVPPLLVLGDVVDATDCETPIPEALVEIWYADEEGGYDNNTDDFLHRGRQLTNENGGYEFQTIVPGRYLNGGTFRPAHIHFRVTAPGYKELVSQIYFKDDPFIESDPWASAPEAELRILTIGEVKDCDAVRFDVYLEKI